MSYCFDPELAAALPLLPNISLPDMGVEAAREALRAMFAAIGEPDETGVEVSELEVKGLRDEPAVRVRIYRPEGGSGRLPCVLNIHGGGFVLGDLDMDTGRCVDIAKDVGAVVVSVDYRLAPEHPYPAGLEDCYTALAWISEAAGELGIDRSRVAVYGQSAGGGLAAGLALLARDRGGPSLCYQFLDIPELDDRLSTDSMNRFADTPGWNRPNAVVSWRCYLGEDVAGGNNVPVYAAPARAVDLAGLPATYISVMEFDPLRDEGLAYAHALLHAEVSVELHLFPGTFHGSAFVAHPAVSRRQALECAAVLRRALGM